jgi:hypothetical protein
MNAASPSTTLATPRPCRVIDDGAELPAAVVEIHEGSLDAVIVRSVFPAELVAEIAARLGAGDVELSMFHPPDGRKGLVYGWPLVASEDSLDSYLERAKQFRTVCSSLFGGDGEPERTIAKALASLAGGREVSVPRAEDGRRYLPATIRYLSAGDLLPLHYENEVLRWPAVRSLAEKLDRSTLMSFYIPMVLSERGGELRLYRATCLGGGSARIGELGGDEAARPQLESEGYEVLRPGPGDLLVFDGGRRYHEVTRIEGRDRWTMGGVLAFSADHHSLHFWS